MKLDESRPMFQALMLMFLASILSTCGDDGSSSKDDRGVFGEMADPITQTWVDYLDSNQMILASADSMLPHVRAAFDLSVARESAFSPSLSCLPEGAGGRLYTFDGVAYSGSEDPTIPDQVARFTFYELSEAGRPLLDHPVGFGEYSCTGSDWKTTSFRIFEGSDLVLSMEFSTFNRGFSGVLRRRDSADSLIWDGGINDFEKSVVRFDADGRTEVRIHFPSLNTLVTQEDSTASWLCEIAFSKLSPEVAGCVFLENTSPGGGDGRLAACVSGESIDSLVYFTPVNNCCISLLLMEATKPQFEAMEQIHMSSLHLGQRAMSALDVCRSLVPE